MNFPKKIHFIWLGQHIPKKYLHHIYTFLAATKRQGFQINLWVNKENIYHLPSVLCELNMIQHGLRIRNVNEFLLTQAIDPRLIKIINSEMVGFYNHGAASDILRLLILLKEGGYYFDTDTMYAPRLSLQHTNFLEYPSKLGFRAAFLPARSDTGKHDAEAFSNAIIASIPDHDILHKALKQIIDEYTKVKPPILAAKRNFFCTDMRLEQTIKMTGPAVLNGAINDYVFLYDMDAQRSRIRGIEHESDGFDVEDFLFDNLNFPVRVGLDDRSSDSNIVVFSDVSWLKLKKNEMAKFQAFTI